VALDRPELRRLDRALPVQRLAERIDDAADQRLAHGHLGDARGALDEIAFLDGPLLAEEHGAHVVLLEVQDEPVDRTGELAQLPGHRLLQAVDPGDAAPDLDDPPDLGEVGLGLEALDLAADDLADFSGLDHAIPPASPASRSRRRASWPRRLMSSRRLPTSAT